MQLPADLRKAISHALEGVSRNALAERAERISELYRGGAASAHAVRDPMDALAYAVSRMPATYAAVRNALSRLQDRSPNFAPRSILDLGSGPGTASWAAADAWPQIESIAQFDSSAPLLALSKSLATSAASQALRTANRITANIAHGFESASSADLIIASYTLAELTRPHLESVLLHAWRRCTGALMIVEPGTPAGYARILEARDQLIAQHAHILAPCPHEQKCPLTAGDWCHFVQRVARSRDHMILKSAALPYEDEKFSYLIAVREALFTPAANHRILARPDLTKTSFTAKVCNPDGASSLVVISKRDSEAFHLAKKKEWGDDLEHG